jgi:hypothetical protein
VRFYLAADLLSIKPNKKYTQAVHMNHEHWRSFIAEFQLGGVCEYNITTIKRVEHQFLNIGDRKIKVSSRFHLPKRQYALNNKNRPRKPEFHVIAEQKNFRAALKSLEAKAEAFQEQQAAKEVVIEEYSDEEEEGEEEFDNGLRKTNICGDTFPLLQKLPGGKDTIDSNMVSALLEDLKQLPDLMNEKRKQMMHRLRAAAPITINLSETRWAEKQ